METNTSKANFFAIVMFMYVLRLLVRALHLYRTFWPCDRHLTSRNICFDGCHLTFPSLAHARGISCLRASNACGISHLASHIPCCPLFSFALRTEAKSIAKNYQNAAQPPLRTRSKAERRETATLAPVPPAKYPQTDGRNANPIPV